MARRDDDDRRVQGLANELLWLGRHADVLAGDVQVTEIRLKITWDEHAEHMAVVKAVSEGGALVAFVTAPELDVLVHLVAAKLQNGTMNWREDIPYGSRK